MSGQVVRSSFSPSWWLGGPHRQTLFPNTVRRAPRSSLDWETFDLSDGDFLELAWTGPPDGPIAVVLHGLGGNYQSPPVRGLTAALGADGWRVCNFHFRGCGRWPNRAVTAYHSGMTADPLEVLSALRQRFPERLLVAVGYSLGGNVLLRLLGETADQAPIDAGVAVSVPFLLNRCADRMEVGASRLYQGVLLRRLRQYLKLRRRRPGPSGPVGPAMAARTFREFDSAFTAPVHGYLDADDYYRRASSRPMLRHISRPTLVIHSTDDPFMHSDVVPEAGELSSHVTLELTARGGHVGFVTGPPWRPAYWLEERIPAWLSELRRTLESDSA